MSGYGNLSNLGHLGGQVGHENRTVVILGKLESQNGQLKSSLIFQNKLNKVFGKLKRSVIGAVKLPSPNHLGPGLIFQLPPLAYMLYPAVAHTMRKK